MTRLPKGKLSRLPRLPRLSRNSVDNLELYEIAEMMPSQKDKNKGLIPQTKRYRPLDTESIAHYAKVVDIKRDILASQIGMSTFMTCWKLEENANLLQVKELENNRKFEEIR